ncbi:hypothetical protein SAMN05519103_03278 [Rhizobiales bacterium GAS113]|nr:hypothetical protein SAMN05519103_03278 [Rhizobiales bacterium GAS113]
MTMQSLSGKVADPRVLVQEILVRPVKQVAP